MNRIGMVDEVEILNYRSNEDEVFLGFFDLKVSVFEDGVDHGAFVLTNMKLFQKNGVKRIAYSYNMEPPPNLLANPEKSKKFHDRMINKLNEFIERK